MSITRVYCLVYDNEYIYLPIKAEYYPEAAGRPKKRAYLGLLPNLFGGKVEGSASIHDTLCAEISQESQGKIELNVINLQDDNMLYKEKVNGSRGDEYYYFWKVGIADIADMVRTFPDFEDGNRLNLSNDIGIAAKCREMKCLIRVPIHELITMLNNVRREAGESLDASDEGCITEFLGICGQSYGDAACFNARKNALREQWDGSGTKMAFVNYLRDLQGIDRLPLPIV